jgi:hypothetical protein
LQFIRQQQKVSRLDAPAVVHVKNIDLILPQRLRSIDGRHDQRAVLRQVADKRLVAKNDGAAGLVTQQLDGKHQSGKLPGAVVEMKHAPARVPQHRLSLKRYTRSIEAGRELERLIGS